MNEAIRLAIFGSAVRLIVQFLRPARAFCSFDFFPYVKKVEQNRLFFLKILFSYFSYQLRPEKGLQKSKLISEKRSTVK